MRYVSLLERGKHHPTLDTLRRMSDVFGMPLSQLILEAETQISQADIKPHQL